MGALGRLPDFVIIGGMKCGTTTLFRYLAHHPAIEPCRHKEPGYFSKVAWDKGLDWYRSLFPETDHLTFEASTAYTKHPNFGPVPERIARVIPDAKLIYSIRHPVDRVQSELLHNVRAGRTQRAMLKDPEQLREIMQFPIRCSRYYWQLEQYLAHFDPAQICIVTLEELIRQPARTLNAILTFLGISSGHYPAGMSLRNYNAADRMNLRRWWQSWTDHKSLANWSLPPQLALEVWEQCADDIEKMETLIGRPLHYAAPAIQSTR